MSNSNKIQKLNQDMLKEIDERVTEMTEEKPEHDPETLSKLDRVEALFRSEAITKDELKTLVKHIFVRSPRFSLVERTKLNYKHLMADFSAAWEESGRGLAGDARDFVYMCGKWVVKVSSTGVFKLLYAGDSLVHNGIIKPIVFTGVLLYSCIEAIVEHLWAALTYAGQGIQKAWDGRKSAANPVHAEKSGDTVTLDRQPLLAAVPQI